MDLVNIGGTEVGPGKPPYIIAEIGANHNGDMGLCGELIASAKDCGVNAVKFQSWTKASLISVPEYHRRNGATRLETRGETLEATVDRYSLTAENHHVIADQCDRLGIAWFSSCFSREEVDLLDSFGIPAFKIASMDINHLSLLEYVASKGRPVILSTGLATLGEIERALHILQDGGAAGVVLLHCLSVYPSPVEIVNLRNMETLRLAFDVPVGYSDHTLGVAVPTAAVALGACIIEKHFTTDKSLPGWDHAISADPAEMTALVQGAQEAYAATGSSVRRISEVQVEKRKAFRRRMVVRRSMKQGERVSISDVDFKRPGTGIHPDELSYVLGRPLAREVEAEAELNWEDIV